MRRILLFLALIASAPACRPADAATYGRFVGANQVAFAYTAPIDLVAGTGTYTIIPPTAGRLVALRIVNGLVPALEVKTTGGTVSVSPTVSCGTNSPSYNNLVASGTITGITTAVAEQIVGMNAAAGITALDLSANGLVLNVITGATGTNPVLTARFLVTYVLAPL